MTATSVRRGRPPLLDLEELRRRALAVVIRQGYEATTMEQIAREAGVSVRTLHRHFPGKSEIVWGAIDASFLALRDALQQQPRDAPAIDALTSAVVSVFDDSTAGYELSRTRIRLISTTPGLPPSQSEAFLQWRTEIAAFVAERLGEPADGLAVSAVSAAAQAAIMAALTWWATADDADSPREAVLTALNGVAALVDR